MPKEEIKPNGLELEMSEKPEKPAKEQIEVGEDDFDFGGISEGVPFQRNIGCGG